MTFVENVFVNDMYRSFKMHMQDPLKAAVSVFVVNFAIIECSTRIGKLIGQLFSNETVSQRNFKYGCLQPLVVGLIASSNVAFIRMTGIEIPPFVVAALVITSFFIKVQTENFMR